MVMRGIAELSAITSYLSAAGVPESAWRIDLGLARGLDYYTGLVLETTVNGWERYGSICSGGRYENLAGLFTSRKLPGVGASIGLDRLLELLGEAGQLYASATNTPILVVNMTGVARRTHDQGSRATPDSLQNTDDETIGKIKEFYFDDRHWNRSLSGRGHGKLGGPARVSGVDCDHPWSWRVHQWRDSL